MISEAKHKETKGIGLKLLTPKQMIQRLPIALAQVKAGNTSFFVSIKGITKKLYNNIFKLI